MLDVSFNAVDPFPVDGVELRLSGFSNSSYKDSKDWLSLGTGKVKEDEIALAQETMVWIPVLEVAWDEQMRRVVVFILPILVRAAEIVDIA